MATPILAPGAAFPRARRATPVLPSHQQLIALAIEKARCDLRELAEILRNDEDYREEDDDAETTVCLAAEQIERMKDMTFADDGEFDTQWFMAVAALKLAAKNYSRPDSLYGRSLIATRDIASALSELVEFAQLQGRGQAQCAAPARS